MIRYVTGNLFESPAQTLVNTVNTVGVMGKGIAKTFKEIYPDMFREYQEFCEKGQLKIGRLHFYRTPNKLIVNFPTKEDWRRPSRLEYIEAGLQTFAKVHRVAGIESVAFPPLGCGNGELDFNDVRPMMEDYLAPLPISVYIYPPQTSAELAEHRTPKEICEWLRGEPQSMPFAEVWEDLRALLSSTGRTLKTLTPGGVFHATYVDADPDPYIWIRSGEKSGEVPRPLLHTLWSELRRHGFVTAKTVDPKFSDFVIPLLAELPYVALVRLSDDYDRFAAGRGLGLQLVPQTPRTQRALAL